MQLARANGAGKIVPESLVLFGQQLPDYLRARSSLSRYVGDHGGWNDAVQVQGGAFDGSFDFFGPYRLTEIVIHTRSQAKLAIFFHRVGGPGHNIRPSGRARS